MSGVNKQRQKTKAKNNKKVTWYKKKARAKVNTGIMSSIVIPEEIQWS